MNEWSSESLLAQRIKNAEKNTEKQERVLADIIVAVTAELRSNANFIRPINLHDARELIKDLDDDQLKELQEGVNAGIDKHNWTRLASHRTFSLISY